MKINPTDELILILDFGAQYTQLIARKVRECGVYCEIIPHDTPVDEIRKRHPKGIIFSGGPASVYEPGAPGVEEEIYEPGWPVLGICYGHQLMARQLGGEVVPAEKREYGRADLNVIEDTVLFQGQPRRLQCWMSHGDTVLAPPPGFQVLAVTETTPVAAMGNPARKIYGVQFHPEVAHTPFGKELLRLLSVSAVPSG